MFSIIIPTLNEEKYIEQLLRSLAPQLQKGDELIVVDSYSEDMTVAIAKKYGCRIISMPRKGIAAAKNTGARKAKNPIIVFLDADSVVAKDWLSRISSHFQTSGVVAVAGLDLYSTDTNYQSPDQKPSASASRIYHKICNKLYNLYSCAVFYSGLTLYSLSGKPWIPSNNCAIRRDIFLKIGGYRSVVCEDAELMRRWPKDAQVRYDHAAVVSLSDRRFRKNGFLKTVLLWVIADIMAWVGKGTPATSYTRV